jgi:hypothetical protein
VRASNLRSVPFRGPLRRWRRLYGRRAGVDRSRAAAHRTIGVVVAMPSFAQNEAARRQEKLEAMQVQIERGSLTVRQMTAAERKLNPPRPDKPLRKRRP